MTGNTIERARGRWPEILVHFVDRRFLQNKHGPCPICGGRDRFRFDDKNGEGTYYCNQCGAGCGLILIRKLRGWDHATACREVDKLIVNCKAGAGTTTKTAATLPVKKRADLDRLLRDARDHLLVTTYLR